MKTKYMFIQVVALFTITTNVNSALVSRLGGLAYYDTDLDITWLTNANLATSSALSQDLLDDLSPYVTTEGRTKQWVADIMIEELNNNGYLGLNNWRLPETGPINGVNYNFSGSGGIGEKDWGTNLSAPGTLYAGSTINEMAYLFYNTLGNTTAGLTNSGPFSNLNSVGYYLTGTAFLYQGSNKEFVFSFGSGAQWYYTKNASFINGLAWAVRDGDISPVPVPASLWLFISGCIGLIALRKRNA